MANEFRKVTDQNGVDHPITDQIAQNGVIANTKLIKDTVGWSGKNKWDKSKETGIDATITQTSDGFRAQVSSHAWGSARCDFATPAKNTDFILSCKANVTTAGNFMKMQVYGSTDGSDYSTSIAVTDTYSATKELELAFNSGNYNYLRITLYLTNGTAASADVTFEKPMLRDADILDSTYEPYFGSTAFPRSEQAVLGAKNFYDIDSVTNLSSVSITNGECANTEIDTRTTFAGNMWFYNNTTLVGSVPSLGTNKTGYVEHSITIPANITKIRFGHSGSQRNITWDVSAIPSGDYILSYVADGINPSTVGGLVIKNIMVRLASDPDDTFAPYAMTNRELTEKVTLSDITVTPATGITFNTTNTRCVKEGDKCLFNVDTQSISLTADTALEIGSISSADAPKQPVFGFAYSYNTGGAVRLTINANGKITLLSKTALTNDYIQGSVSWFVNR